MEFPQHLKYTKEHEWYDAQTQYVGITEYAQKELGDIVYVDITTLNETLAQNAVFGSIEAVKTVSDLYLPLSATILEVNPDLETNPELVNHEPYQKGWIVKVSPQKPAEIDNLLDAEAYTAYIESL